MNQNLAATVTAAVTGGLYYLLFRGERRNNNNNRRMANGSDEDFQIIGEGAGIEPSRIPRDPIINNLDSLLHDIYVRHVAIRSDDFKLYYKVFSELFDRMQEKMKEVDPYYRQYSSRKQFAGSHFDNLRINKPDEFDMDIVISLPVDFDENRFDSSVSDITFEPKHAAFTQLKMGKQYQNLPMRDLQQWQTNKTAYNWRDEKNYLLCNKFVDWFKSVVIRALNLMGGQIWVDGVNYKISRSESGPAITIKVTTFDGFGLDVDFVPALKFPESRWPISRAYRKISSDCSTGDWMLVPKPNKGAAITQEVNRCWRIALHNQERGVIHDCYNLKQTIRLMKKLRDSQNMNKIASYYIKTLFLWEMDRHDKFFWRSPLSVLFKLMVSRLRDAVVQENIPYYWNKNNNLIAGVSSATLMQYKAVLDKLLTILNDPLRFKEVAKYLLNGSEYLNYRLQFLEI